ncbi:aldehyde dehydrogenase family protein [Acinetobacter baylyi]|uniref:aldehyde dehydrogenase family protein n=1 Tax=Acinetobacter baylyi TaxID=202950 RepID=UPI000EA23CA0|nr:aldehyde dehydrogenase family protein [Acinetobacter baylyi]
MNTDLFINGATVKGTNSIINVLNPANEQRVASVPSASIEQVEEAVAAAKNAFNQWQQTSDQTVIDCFNAIADEVMQCKDEIAQLITQEQGKPLFLAQAEVDITVGWIRSVAELSIPVEHYQENGKDIKVYNRPLGVIASVTPWNWPFMIAAWHIFPALKAKNTVVNKPSEFTPLSTIKLVEIINRHLPQGVCNIVLGDGKVGAALTSHPNVEKVTFTGSTVTGQRILQGAIDDLKSVVLELGGNDVGIVLEDANLDEAIPKIFQSAFLNAGQTCACLKRLYVHESLYDQVIEHLIALINDQVVGDGLNPETTFGPLQNKIQYQKVLELIADAEASGANIIRPAQSVPETGYFIAPTLVTDIDEQSALVQTEQFGPVLPILKFTDVNQVIDSTNQSEYGLGGSVWSSNLEYAEQIASRMQTGTVWINSHSDLSPQAAFGGWKLSGLGYSFGLNGLLQYTHKQSVHLSPA